MCRFGGCAGGRVSSEGGTGFAWDEILILIERTHDEETTVWEWEGVVTNGSLMRMEKTHDKFDREMVQTRLRKREREIERDTNVQTINTLRFWFYTSTHSFVRNGDGYEWLMSLVCCRCQDSDSVHLSSLRIAYWPEHLLRYDNEHEEHDDDDNETGLLKN